MQNKSKMFSTNTYNTLQKNIKEIPLKSPAMIEEFRGNRRAFQFNGFSLSFLTN
jgi:hypothetical protein